MEVMEKFELAITVLLIVLVMICVYIAASWTLWKRQKKKNLVEEWLDKESSAFRKGFVPEGEEGLPKITITPIQPRPDISNEVSASPTDTEEDGLGYDSQDIDLGRLYFALQYDHTRSVLCVRLIRGEDIPMERDISATYVGVRLLPLRLQGEQVQPYETSINVSFQECYEFPLAESELAQQTLDFHICRYDRFSRKVAIGDVYLALAELGAQGIDISKEVYLCRNLIHSREAYYSEEESRANEEYISEGKPRPSARIGKPRPAKALSLWKIVQAAVLKGRFRGLTQSLGGQDSPFYWESMFSSGGEGENAEASPPRVAPVLYRPSSPEKEREKEQREDDDDEINIDEVVRKGERSGSFLFPSKSDEEEEDVEGDQAEILPTPLQISPAPEEYYRLVPFTPYTPASPLKKPKDPNVSWHVPESFTSKGPDVVQALSDIYTDPRIVTSANLRQNRHSAESAISGIKTKGQNSQKGLPAQATSTDSDRARSSNSTKMHSRTKKRKREETRKLSSPPKGSRKVVRSTKRHKRKRSGQHEEKKDSQAEPNQRRATNRVFKIKPQKTRSMSTSSEEDFELHSKKSGHHSCKPSQREDTKRKTFSAGRVQEMHSEDQALVFEAKDFIGSCFYPLKNRAQSAPSVLKENSIRTRRERHDTRPSVSMSDVRDSHIDSSDVSSDFEQF